MNIPSSMHKALVEEINFVIENMRAVHTQGEKIYFFSAVFGMSQRIINFQYDPELNFVHMVTRLVYDTINSRLLSMSTGQERAIIIPDQLFTKLEDALEEMVNSIEQGFGTYSALQKMVSLAYSTTGNGYYLYKKGMLTL